LSRILYYVVPDQPGWRVDGEGASWGHPSKDAARRRALTYARYQWEICGRPAGVLVRRDDGEGFERFDFGLDEDATGISVLR
jgi:hypothetical protein